jgi:hypothetical protein
LIEDHAEEYLAAKTKLDKTQVIVAVIDKIRKNSPDGGFVKKDFYSERWYEIGNEKARDKVGHAIRKASELLESKKTGKVIHNKRKSGRKRKTPENKLSQQQKRPARPKEDAPTSLRGDNNDQQPSSQTSTTSLHARHQPALRMGSDGIEQALRRPNFFPNNLTNSLGSGGVNRSNVGRTSSSFSDNGSLFGRPYLPAQTALLDMQIPPASLWNGSHASLLSHDHGTALSQLHSRIGDYVPRQGTFPGASSTSSNGNMAINAAAEGLLRDEKMSLRPNAGLLLSSSRTSLPAGVGAAGRLMWPPYNGDMNPLTSTLPPVGLGGSLTSELATLRYLRMGNRSFLTALGDRRGDCSHRNLEAGNVPEHIYNAASSERPPGQKPGADED